MPTSKTSPRKLARNYTSYALLFLCGASLLFVLVRVNSCVPIVAGFSEEGSQGARVWFGETLMSFQHEDRAICIPSGWEAVGALETENGQTRFEKGVSGVVIKTDAFHSRTLLPTNTSYEVRFLFPKETPKDFVSAYERMTLHAFENVGRLYGDSPAALKKLHTVLVTAGLAGNTYEKGTRVYPDPHKSLTTIVRTADQSRSEELLIHAIAHLYNRFSDRDDAYLLRQTPFLPEDFEELEASWTEIAYASPLAARARIAYLYNIHGAVLTKDFSQIKEPPFNDREAFMHMGGTVIVEPGSSYLEYQYGHYALAPLMMVALEGMLEEAKSAYTVESLLQETHKNQQSFLSLIAETLSKDAAETFIKWVEGTSKIPSYLVSLGVSRYHGNTQTLYPL